MAFDLIYGNTARNIARDNERASEMGHSTSMTEKEGRGLLYAALALGVTAGGAYLLLERSRRKLSAASGPNFGERMKMIRHTFHPEEFSPSASSRHEERDIDDPDYDTRSKPSAFSPPPSTFHRMENSMTSSEEDKR